MRLSRAYLVVALAAAVLSSGCIANMPELKERLGVEEPVVTESFVPPPPLEPPVARAQANATSVLVGQPVRFMSEGTRDPRGLALSFAWDFGDARTGKGPVAVHAYDKAGEYLVRLRVVNAEGLADEDTLTMRVALGNRAPVAAFRVLDAQGEEPRKLACGERVTFESSSSDPDAHPLVHDWDLGDGTTSHDPRPTHAYERPGLYVARLAVADPAGLRAEVSREVRVGCRYETSGTLEATQTSASYKFPVARDATSIAVTLRFPAGMGLTDLQLVLRDAAGTEVARTGGQTPPGVQDEQARLLALSADEIAALAAGEWTAEVVKRQGVQSTWALDISQSV